MADEEDVERLKAQIGGLKQMVENQAARLLALESIVVCLGRATKRRYKISDAMAIGLIQKATAGDPRAEQLARKAARICQQLLAATLR